MQVQTTEVKARLSYMNRVQIRSSKRARFAEAPYS